MPHSFPFWCLLKRQIKRQMPGSCCDPRFLDSMQMLLKKRPKGKIKEQNVSVVVAALTLQRVWMDFFCDCLTKTIKSCDRVSTSLNFLLRLHSLQKGCVDYCGFMSHGGLLDPFACPWTATNLYGLLCKESKTCCGLLYWLMKTRLNQGSPCGIASLA